MGIRAKSREGFSLIEVIIAVCILAILSVPILLYFTNSAIHSARGKQEQAADMASQSIVEEIDSMTDFDLLEERFDSLRNSEGNPVWNIVTAEDGTKQTAKRVDSYEDPWEWDIPETVMYRDITVDGDVYKAVATINYGVDVYNPNVVDGAAVPVEDEDDGPPPPTAMYNSYKTPHLQELYSASSVVISEGKDVYNTGVYGLYYQINGHPASEGDASSLSTIRDGVDRTFVLRIDQDPGDDKMYCVQASYEFSYGSDSDGNPYKSSVPLANERVEKKNLKNIYFMFRPFWAYSYDGSGSANTENIEEKARFEFGTDTPWGTNTGEESVKADLSISFMKQDVLYKDSTDTEKIVEDNSTYYKINFETAGTEDLTNIRFYGNNKIQLPGAFNFETGEVYGDTDTPVSLLNETYDKRIARIQIKIYDSRDGWSIDDPGDEKAVLETTKSI